MIAVRQRQRTLDPDQPDDHEKTEPANELGVFEAQRPEKLMRAHRPVVLLSEVGQREKELDLGLVEITH